MQVSGSWPQMCTPNPSCLVLDTGPQHGTQAWHLRWSTLPAARGAQDLPRLGRASEQPTCCGRRLWRASGRAALPPPSSPFPVMCRSTTMPGRASQKQVQAGDEYSSAALRAAGCSARASRSACLLAECCITRCLSRWTVAGSNFNRQRGRRYMWRVTHEQQWRDYGWTMFQSFQKHCRQPDGSYSGIHVRPACWCYWSRRADQAAASFRGLAHSSVHDTAAATCSGACKAQLFIFVSALASHAAWCGASMQGPRITCLNDCKSSPHAQGNTPLSSWELCSSGSSPPAAG